MRIKKIITTCFLLISSTLFLSSCAKDDQIAYKEEKLEFVNLANSYYDMKANSLNIYYVDNSDIQYVDAGNFMKTLDGFYQSSLFKKSISSFRNIYNIYVYANTGNGIEYISCVFDWNKNTITVNNPLFFNIKYNPSSVEFMTHLEEGKAEIENRKEIVFDLAKYGFDIYYKNGKCLVPFSIMNTIFCSDGYYNLYNNGDIIYGTYYDISIVSDETYNSIYNDNLSNKGQTNELRLETYNHLRFVMNNYYGLKKFKEIDDFDSILENYKEDILSLDVEKNRKAYYNLFSTYLNDLHTRIGAYSFYNTKEIAIPTYAAKDMWDSNKLSENRKIYKEKIQYLSNLSKDIYPNNESTYRTYDKTAILYMSEFNVGTTEQNKSLDAYKYDSYEYMKWALKNIEDKGIKNVVLDLSQNGGGVVAALLKVLGFVSNDDITYRIYDTLADSTTSVKFRVDINADDDYSDLDAYTNYNWYVLAGVNTYSAANTFVGMSKELGVKSIGQKSGGGMCSVLPIVLADTTTVEMSSTNAMYTYVNNKLVFMEGGFEPDIELDYDKFYDIEYINSILNN